MKSYVAYVLATGEIMRSGRCRDEDLESQPMSGLRILVGDGSRATHWVQSGQIVPYTQVQRAAKAQRASINATWSNEVMAWVEPMDDLFAAKAARFKRDKLLSSCDWTQLDDAPFAAPGKLLWRAYRAALRDLTKQAGFPRTINWPTPPG